MAQSQVAIIGTGLIGTSIGLNLMARKDRSYTVVGADRDRGAARTAKKFGALDREVGSIEEAVEGAGLVILAVPVMGARRILQDAARYVKPGTVITDTCSTKAEVMRWAEEFLPAEVYFVGGHPMAGKEASGPEAATVDLFKEATWAMTPSPRAHEGAVQVVQGLIESMGATPLYIDPAEHDQYAAAISHVPLLISVALFRMARDSAAWDDLSLLAGPGFRDLTRLASGDPAMARDIVSTNREAIVHWLRRFRDELDTVAKAVEVGDEPVKDLLASTQLDRDTFILNPPRRRRIEKMEAPSAQDAIGHMFVGGMYDRLKQMSSANGDGGRAPRTTDSDRELRRKLGIEEDDDRR
ncbi:MAG: prephenate dehydrogenase/arogenate dehydrogenase family protein [Chloroflexi bacterium]|nr:prephenate dehydrogenase/arogenate dehydrogenase family protein [Chloroflexota bacterium]